MIGEKLKKLRTQHRLSQRQVAEVLNIDRSTYTYYETHKTRPDVNMLPRLAKLYNVTTDYLLDDSSEDYLPVMQHFSDPSLGLLNDNPFVMASDEPAQKVTFGQISEDEKKLLLLFRQLTDEDKEEMILNALVKIVNK